MKIKKRNLRWFNCAMLVGVLVCFCIGAFVEGMLAPAIIALVFCILAIIGGIYAQKDYRDYLNLEDSLAQMDLREMLQTLQDEEKFEIWVTYAPRSEIDKLMSIYAQLPREHPCYADLAYLLFRVRQKRH